MKTSRNGVLFIMAEEAIVLSSYRDSGGVWTIGSGHTATAGPPVPKPGLEITLEEALTIKARDLGKFEAGVLRAVDMIRLKQHEFDALVSFHYNTGAIQKGSVDDKLEAGRIADAMATLKSYRKDNGKVIAGLEARRAREAALFQTGDYALRPIRLYQTYPGKFRLLSPADIAWPAEPRVQPPSPVPPPPVPPKPPAPAGEASRGFWAMLINFIAAMFKPKGTKP